MGANTSSINATSGVDASNIAKETKNITYHGNDISFNDTINNDSIIRLIKLFIIIVDKSIKDTESGKSVEEKSRIDIKLYIDSTGGCVKDAFKFIDFIGILRKSNNIHLTTIGIGRILSAATLIFLVGDVKCLTSNVEIMIHEISTAIKYTNITYIISRTDAQMKTNNKMINLYLASNKKIKRNDLEQLLRKESWLNAEEYIELGFADEII